jgi:hypothetical protein
LVVGVVTVFFSEKYFNFLVDRKIEIRIYFIFYVNYKKMDTMNTRIVNNADKKYGCAICFGRFEQKEKVLVCQEPCNKLFHPECFYKSIEEAVSLCDITCCYCKRELITEGNLHDRHNTFVQDLLQRKYGRNSRFSFSVIYVKTNAQNILNIETQTVTRYPVKPENSIKRPKRGACPPDPPRWTLYRGCRGRAPKGL